MLSITVATTLVQKKQSRACSVVPTIGSFLLNLVFGAIARLPGKGRNQHPRGFCSHLSLTQASDET